MRSLLYLTFFILQKLFFSIMTLTNLNNCHLRNFWLCPKKTYSLGSEHAIFEERKIVIFDPDRDFQTLLVRDASVGDKAACACREKLLQTQGFENSALAFSIAVLGKIVINKKILNFIPKIYF